MNGNGGAANINNNNVNGNGGTANINNNNVNGANGANINNNNIGLYSLKFKKQFYKED